VQKLLSSHSQVCPPDDEDVIDDDVAVVDDADTALVVAAWPPAPPSHWAGMSVLVTPPQQITDKQVAMDPAT